MLDLKLIRSRPDDVRRALEAKGETGADLNRLLEIDQIWRAKLARVEELRAE
ncbi:MAG: serine--tRNA ligase, partial [Candidatus Eisenbacteria bacterium]|nr:serine--tRNA ligase [Candidatus Eisenbacteria bacterium]